MMCRVSSNRNGQETLIYHFSHPHPLQLSTLQNNLFPAQCAGCTLRATGLTYTCKTCNYFLHTTCSQMAPLVQHPSHPIHPLTLLPIPAYPEGNFNCDACGHQGTAFSYHCNICEVDFHSLCAAMPFSSNHQAHNHVLKLTFSPPYNDSTRFYCDICNNVGCTKWLYRCAVCEFDAHLNCATAASRPVQARPRFQPPPVAAGIPVRAVSRVNAPGPCPVMAQMGSNNNNQMGYDLARPLTQGFMEGVGRQLGQSVVKDILGGGGDGGDDSGDEDLGPSLVEFVAGIFG